MYVLKDYSKQSEIYKISEIYYICSDYVIVNENFVYNSDLSFYFNILYSVKFFVQFQKNK